MFAACAGGLGMTPFLQGTGGVEFPTFFTRFVHPGTDATSTLHRRPEPPKEHVFRTYRKIVLPRCRLTDMASEAFDKTTFQIAN